MWILGLVAGCIDPRLAMDVPVVAGGADAADLTTSDGGTVLIEEATVTFGDLRLEQPAVTVASVLRALSPIQAAYAHPGHDYPGDVAGELLGTFTVDLLAEDAELGDAACYEGDYATGRVSLAGIAALVAGTYTNAAGDSRPFRFEVTADQDIVAIPFETTMSLADPPEAVSLRFDLAAALAYVDWTAPDTDGDGTLTIADADYDNTVRFGIVATPSWSLAVVR